MSLYGQTTVSAVAPAGTPGEPNRAHGRLGARADQPHLLDRGKRVDDLRGQLHLTLSCGAEGRALVRGLLHGLDRIPIGVTEYKGTERHHQVDVAPAVG